MVATLPSKESAGGEKLLGVCEEHHCPRHLSRPCKGCRRCLRSIPPLPMLGTCLECGTFSTPPLMRSSLCSLLLKSVKEFYICT